MIKHSLKNDIVHISIDKMNFSYRIPVNKIGSTIDWRIGEKGTKGILIKNVSTWTLQLFTKDITEHKYIKEFISIVQEYISDNTINWEQTQLALNIQNKYNWLITTNKTAKKKNSEEEIISTLKMKFNLE
jgi:hypothetical protein